MKKVINEKNKSIIVEKLEVANSFRTRLIGLMGRKKLKEGEGLLIKRSGNSIHTFFMRFPIDLVFVDKDGQVKHIVKDLKPWRMAMAPLLRQTDCLELPAGTVKKTNTRIGDTLLVKT